MLPEDILRTPGDASELKFAWDLGFTSRFPDDVRADTSSASAGNIMKVSHHLLSICCPQASNVRPVL